MTEKRIEEILHEHAAGRVNLTARQLGVLMHARDVAAARHDRAVDYDPLLDCLVSTADKLSAAHHDRLVAARDASMASVPVVRPGPTTIPVHLPAPGVALLGQPSQRQLNYVSDHWQRCWYCKEEHNMPVEHLGGPLFFLLCLFTLGVWWMICCAYSFHIARPPCPRDSQPDPGIPFATTQVYKCPTTVNLPRSSRNSSEASARLLVKMLSPRSRGRWRAPRGKAGFGGKLYGGR